VGARLDRQPELLFELRAVDRNELVTHLDIGLPLSKTEPDAGKVLADDDMAALFGLDMAAEVPPVAVVPKAKAKAKKVSKVVAVQPKVKAKTKAPAKEKLPPWPIADAAD
jgi:uncharacterized Zn finger protein